MAVRTLTYGRETWITTKKKQENRILSQEMKFLRKRMKRCTKTTSKMFKFEENSTYITLTKRYWSID